MIRLVTAFSMLFTLSACSDPVVVPPVSIQDHAMSCEDLERDIAQTKHFKAAARADDGFEWKHIFVVNAFVSYARMNDAENAAEDRLRELEDIYRGKGCAAHPVINP